VGVEAPQVTVEVHLSGGLPRTQIVGAISPKAEISAATENFRS
jgi:predicted ATPase with chaperone activity